MSTTSKINGRLGHWMASLEAPPQRFARVPEGHRVDVGIVGGGYTGLWTAYFLKKHRPELSVGVFEAERFGYGASGRNGGWVSSLVPGNRASMSASSPGGKNSAIAFQNEFLQSVDEILDVLHAEGIDADQRKGGMLTAATTESGLQRLQLKAEKEREYGLSEAQVRILDREEFADRVRIDGVLGGMALSEGATVNPAKLIRGLLEAVRNLGVELYEGSRVLHLGQHSLQFQHTTVESDRILVCTEGYSGPLVGGRRLVPINSSVIATSPLGEAFWDEVGWNQGQALNDASHIFFYAQRSRDNRIVIGGRGKPYKYASQTGGDGATDSRTIRSLSDRLLALFPSAEFSVDHAWSGVLGVTRDWNGSIAWDPSNRVGYGFGYAGHGVTAAYVAGKTLAELSLGIDSPRSRLPWVNHVPKNWEFEPLRWLGIRSIYGLFALGDAMEKSSNSTRSAPIASLAGRVAGMSE